MPLPRSTPRRELIRKLSTLGFAGPTSGGKHQFMYREQVKVRVPNPHGSDIGVALLSRILRQAGVSEQEYLDA